MKFMLAGISQLVLELIPEDEIDVLFGKLRKIEPSSDLVKQILARVRQLPASLRYPQTPAHSDEEKPASAPEPDRD